MKKYLSLLIIPLFVLTFNGMAFGWGSTGGDGSDYRQLQETAVFLNNSGIRMVHGQAAVLDLDSTASTSAPVKSAVTAGTTMGAYVELLGCGGGCGDIAHSADSNLAVGVVKVAADNQTPVIVVTRGPIDALVVDSSEAISAGSTVGTAAVGEAGTIGAGSNLGIALEAGDGTDGSYCFIWVSPANSD